MPSISCYYRSVNAALASENGWVMIPFFPITDLVKHAVPTKKVAAVAWTASLRIHNCVESARAAFGCLYRHCTAQPIRIDPHIMPIFCIDMIPRKCGKLVVALLYRWKGFPRSERMGASRSWATQVGSARVQAAIP